jgi:hypothetical protein
MYSASGEARVPESDPVFSVQGTLCTGGGGCVSNSGTLASNGQIINSPKYNDDLSLLISQYLFPARDIRIGRGVNPVDQHEFLVYYIVDSMNATCCLII